MISQGVLGNLGVDLIPPKLCAGLVRRRPLSAAQCRGRSWILRPFVYARSWTREKGQAQEVLLVRIPSFLSAAQLLDRVAQQLSMLND